MTLEPLLEVDNDYIKLNQLYDECLDYLEKSKYKERDENDYETVDSSDDKEIDVSHPEIGFKVINELKSMESLNSSETKSERLRKLSQQLPKIIITQSNNSLNLKRDDEKIIENHLPIKNYLKKPPTENHRFMNDTKHQPFFRNRTAYGDFPKRLVSKNGVENVALISNVPFEKIRLLNDTFHTLINLRWRWIVIGTVVVHFAIWLVFAVFWYVTALAHYDFEPDPPSRSCVTGGKDFVTIFLASVEAQTTIGFGDRAIDEECPESIFLFIMQLILGTGLSGVLTCVVYAKLTRPEKLSRDGVGFSKKAVVSLRDGKLCLMFRAWDLNYDHIISSEFTAHFITTYRTQEGEVVRYLSRALPLQQRQFLLWPVTLLHVIDSNSPLYHYTPQHFANNSYEITISLKGASASMGTFTQSQTSYLPREVLWGHRFPPVVKYDPRKQKYVVDHSSLDVTQAVDTPLCSAQQLYRSSASSKESPCPGTPGSFSDKLSTFHLERTSSFKRRDKS
ncbi:PREDICTED: ATP-sensitive inward rectifier potassium channel 11-like [Papilio xuthus]|uniref:ATP-sensitive inward rectifier potassium channel 11-like n=1 Tax=Papilio xuthus TaxID=66420 RepID=A0AAJ6ZAS7_PAPXU|nr:PREDICTED: ATP-sensitive inward rectifier potassium channel 11-like [Papilio xuthus]